MTQPTHTVIEFYISSLDYPCLRVWADARTRYIVFVLDGPEIKWYQYGTLVAALPREGGTSSADIPRIFQRWLDGL